MSTYNGYNPPGEDPYDDFLRWDAEQDEEESERRYLKEQALLKRSEDTHEGRME